MEKYLVFEVTGGAGKNVMATALLRPLQDKYPDRKIIVVASWPDVFIHHSVPYCVYNISNTPNFYHTYIEDKDVIVLRHDPYAVTDYITGKQHLIEAWMNMYDLEYNEYTKYPDLQVNMLSQDWVSSYLNNVNKPILLIHTHGGSNSSSQNYKWTRDMPYYLIVDIVNNNKDKYHIVQVCNYEYQKYGEDTTVITPDTLSLIQTFSLVKLASKRLLIDSCLQHVAAAWGLSSTVLWVGTDYNTLGYDIHNNITPHVDPIDNFKVFNSYLYKYKLEGDPSECPYNTVHLFDSNIIQQELMS